MNGGGGKSTPFDFITQASLLIRVDAREIKDEIARRWHRTLAQGTGTEAGGARTGRGMSVSGSTPPSVFVGSYGYPKVYVGPMVPPVHGDTAIFDSPERWRGLSLGDIVGLRLGMIRGVRQVRSDLTGSGGDSRYVEQLQEVAMSSAPLGSDISFEGPVRVRTARNNYSDDTGTPFGPIGLVRSAEFSDMPRPSRQIEKLYYDTDANASDAMFSLYESGVAMSDIQRCLSIGMLGSRRRLVPTKWSITAADSAISSRLLGHVSECDVIDSCRVFCHEHLGNAFAVVLFENRWLFELVEAWHAPAPDGGSSGSGSASKAAGRASFASDWETSHLQRAPQNTAGAYYATRLGVLEYLAERHVQAGALVLREIRPEYSVPVGVWQVREGVRAAMKNPVAVADSMADGVRLAASATGIDASDWLGHADTTRLARQRTLGDYA